MIDVLETLKQIRERLENMHQRKQRNAVMHTHLELLNGL